MPKIKFTQNYTLNDQHKGTDNETRYEAGQVVDVPEASAAFWAGAGLAERLPEETRRGRKPKPASPEASQAEAAEASAVQAEAVPAAAHNPAPPPALEAPEGDA